MYELTQSVSEAAGLPAYEISNHAADRAAQSIHNRIYWEGGDWIGIGPGAHSRLGRADRGGRLAASAALRPSDYVARVRAGTAHDVEALTAEDEAAERILMGIRPVVDGFSPSLIESATGHCLDADVLGRLMRQGLIEDINGGVRLSRSGRIYADRIGAQLAGA